MGSLGDVGELGLGIGGILGGVQGCWGLGRTWAGRGRDVREGCKVSAGLSTIDLEVNSQLEHYVRG